MALSISNPIPIADLNADIPAPSSVIHGIVTLVWPYSSVNQTYSFLLVEPDPRLRRNRGQVRVSLRGSCARRVTRAGLVSGDEIYLALDGAQWERDSTAASTPGRGIEWQLLYADYLRLERVEEDGNNQVIDTSRMSASPQVQASVPAAVSERPVAILQTPRVLPTSNETFNAWSSPIFIKDKRLPDIFPAKAADGVSDIEEEWLSAPPAKKLKFGRKSDQWRFIERSPTPESDAELVLESGAADELQVVARIPLPSLQPVPLSPTKLSDNGLPTDSTAEQHGIGVPDMSSLDMLVIGTEIENDSFDDEHNGGLAQTETLSQKEESTKAAQEPVPATSLSILSAMQEDTSLEIQSPTPIITTNQIPNVFSDMQAVPEGLFSMPDEVTFGHSSFASNRENDTVETASFQQETQPDFQSQLLSLPQDSFVSSSIALSSQTTLSESQKQHLEINIQSSIPLVEPISLDTGPLTPRLLPLLSPGLDLVSPLEQRHALVQGSYSIGNLQNKVEAASSPQESGTSSSSIQLARELDDETAEIHGLQQIHGNEQQLTAVPAEVGETFFNHLLARYDQATGANLESTGDQPMSSFAAPVEPIKQDQIEDGGGEILPLDQSSSIASPSTKPFSGERNTTIHQDDMETISLQGVDREIDELLDDDSSPTANDEVDTTLIQHKDEEIQEGEAGEDEDEDEEEEDTSLHDLDDVSDDASDDDVSLSGKWRDQTYKPSQNIPHNTEGIESSPLSVRDVATIQPNERSIAQIPAIETIDGASDQSSIVERSRAIQDTYFAGDSHKDESSSQASAEVNDIEVVDLLDSDSSSPLPSSPEDLPTPRAANESQEDIVEAAGGDPELPMMELVPSEEPEVVLILSEEIAETSQPSNPVSRTSSISDKHAVETQHQEFYTAPVDFEEMEEEDLTAIVEDHENGHDPPLTAQPGTRKATEVDLQDPASPTLKSSLSPPKQYPPRSSQRITRSQSQLTADMLDPEDGKAEESLEPIPETDPVSSASAEPAPQGIRTSHDYYSPLTTLSQYHNSTISLLAVVAASSKPIRSTVGPRDFNQTIYLTAPHSQPNNDFTIVQLFRPFESALPHPISSGSIILVKNFKVQSYKRKMSLLSTSTSAWAVFDQTSATNQSEMQVSIAGPPVDFGGAERGIAWGLGKWWSSLDTVSQSKITSAATSARDRAEADLEKKASAARKARETREAKASSSQAQLHLTPRRQTRSTLSQNIPSSIPNTPSTHHATPPSTTRSRKPSIRHAEQSPTPTPVDTPTPSPSKQRHNLRSSPQNTSQDPTHELRSGLLYSDTESDVPLELREAESTIARGAQRDGEVSASDDPDSSTANVKTRAQTRKDGADGSGNALSAAKTVVWHELRDGAVYRD